MKNRILFLLCFFVSINMTVFAQSPTYEKQQFRGLNYRILYPDNFNDEKKYPVLLFLHGAGERGDDNERQLTHGSKLFLDDQFRKNYPSVVIFPQCPSESYWANVNVERGERPYSFDFRNKEEPTEPMKQILALMDSITSLDYAKNDQVYVGGLSMGGMGTFEILYRRPDMFSAAFPICGGADPSIVEGYPNDLSLWVFHGAQDDVVLPSYSTDMVIALMKADHDVKYTLYKDANHNSWDSAFSEPELIPWIFSKTTTQTK